MNGNEIERQAQGAIRWDERLGRIVWPHVEDIDLGTVEAGDVVVLCGGFEERASTLLSRLIELRKVDMVVVLISYSPAYDENRIGELRTMAADAGIDVRECLYNRQEPEGGGERVAELTGGADRVLVDISGMSKLLIVQVVVALMEAELPITIVYGEANEYEPTKEEFERRLGALSGEATLDFLSSGVFEVAATPELASVAMLGEAIRLIVFPSMELVQMKNVLQEVQPTYVDVVYGLPPANENSWRRRAVEVINEGTLRRQEGVTRYEASTLDYRETIDIVLDIYARRSMFDRILVAPTGSKMQAVAVGLVRSVLTDIQIVYPTPQQFNPLTYTRGVKRIHQVCIPLVGVSRL